MVDREGLEPSTN